MREETSFGEAQHYILPVVDIFIFPIDKVLLKNYWANTFKQFYATLAFFKNSIPNPNWLLINYEKSIRILKIFDKMSKFLHQ